MAHSSGSGTFKIPKDSLALVRSWTFFAGTERCSAQSPGEASPSHSRRGPKRGMVLHWLPMRRQRWNKSFLEGLACVVGLPGLLVNHPGHDGVPFRGAVMGVRDAGSRCGQGLSAGPFIAPRRIHLSTKTTAIGDQGGGFCIPHPLTISPPHKDWLLLPLGWVASFCHMVGPWPKPKL